MMFSRPALIIGVIALNPASQVAFNPRAAMP
jgi:hypothetical protein